jgi:hypothetical protein
MIPPAVVAAAAMTMKMTSDTGAPKSSDDGAAATQDETLQRILEGFPDLRISDARLGKPPTGYAGSAGATWVYYKIRAATDPHYVEGHWQALVVSGLLRQISSTHDWPRVRGHSFAIVLPSGQERPDSSSVLGHAFTGTIARSSERALRMFLEASAASVGATVTRIRFARPLGRLAPEVTVEVHDAAAFIENQAQNIWAIVEPVNRGTDRPRAEGTLVHVRNGRGTWVAESGYAVRAASGVSVTNPAFA